MDGSTVPATRRCSKCGLTQPISEFRHRCGAKAHLTYSWCRLCGNAYRKQWRIGRSPPKRRPAASEIFWTHVAKSDGCWTWTSTLMRNGYGSLGKHGSAHRFSWSISHGPIPGGAWVLHHCDNRRCVRPDHLFLGNRRTNADDMLSKRRQALGVRNASAKLTEADVREIRRLRAAGLSLRKIAAKFACNDMNVHYICTRVTWRHIE